MDSQVALYVPRSQTAATRKKRMDMSKYERDTSPILTMTKESDKEMSFDSRSTEHPPAAHFRLTTVD